MNAMDSFLPFLFGFHNKALAFVDKISTGDSKSFEIHSQVFFFPLSLEEKKSYYMKKPYRPQPFCLTLETKTMHK